MSVENVLAFREKLKTDSDLRSKVQSLPRTPAGVDSFIQMGAGAGFHFTQEDFGAALKALRHSGELTEQQLATISGGNDAGIDPGNLIDGLTSALESLSEKIATYQMLNKKPE